MTRQLKLEDGINKPLKGQIAAARFCPFCGVPDKLDRDHYESNLYRRVDNSTVDFICQVCFRGFCLSMSRRGQQAAYLFALDRKARLPNEPKKKETVKQEQARFGEAQTEPREDAEGSKA